MDAGVQPDSPQHYSVDADSNDSPLDMNPGGQINTSAATASVAASIRSIMPVTYTQPTHYNPPLPNNAQWPLTYAVTPLPEASTHVQPTPLIPVTSPAEISQFPVPSPQLSHGVSFRQASFRIGATTSNAAASTIDSLTMSADASMDSSSTTTMMTDLDTTATILSQSAVLASPSPISNAASQSTEIFLTNTESFNKQLTSSPSVLASTIPTVTLSVLPVATESFSSPVAFSFSSLFSASSVLSEPSATASLRSSFRSLTLSLASVSVSESSASSFQSSSTPFVSSTVLTTSLEPLSTTTSTTPTTTRSRTHARTSAAPSTSSHSTTPTQSSTSSTSSQSAFTPAQTTDPPTPSSNVSTGHGTLFYLGIALGAIIFVALTSALIAWAIRLRSRALRRRDEWEAAIPWVKGDPDRTDDMDHLEAGRNEVLNGPRRSPHGGRGGVAGASSAMITSAGAAGIGAFQYPWSPRLGSNYQQALGEPKSFDGDACRPGNSPGRMRKLPSHMVDKELASRAQMEASNYLAVGRFPGSSSASVNGYPIDPMNELGANREAHCMPRFFPASDSRPSIAARIRNLNKPAREDSLEDLSPLPTPGAHLNQAPEQTWGASWKAGISNAFTAMSSRFSVANSSTTAVNSRSAAEEAADRFTRAPSKRALRKSLRDGHYGSSEKLGLARGGSRSTTASKPCTLEEREDGTGFVHLRVPDGDVIDEKYPVGQPGINGPSLSYGDGKNFGSADDFSSEESYAVNPADPPHVHLVVANKPQRALVNPRSACRTGNGTSDESEYFSVISRQTTRSSIYSPQPANYSDPRAIPPPKLTLVPSQGVPYIPSARDQDAHNIPTPSTEDDSVVLQPDEGSSLDRESSAHASMMSSSTVDTKERERYEGVGDALRTRRKGVVGVGRS